eukprot:TRINITY_DN24742_c0_g1_i1.p1 TRINITY_DN24742_c0_g1~~TRINITY_DN24742_c0_g1_i1.p1  ORF type:complete len:1832 (+),score=423.66 TRINITY_DN24742_c0_g1_i1:55-5550(+)
MISGNSVWHAAAQRRDEESVLGPLMPLLGKYSEQDETPSFASCADTSDPSPHFVSAISSLPDVSPARPFCGTMSPDSAVRDYFASTADLPPGSSTLGDPLRNPAVLWGNVRPRFERLPAAYQRPASAAPRQHSKEILRRSDSALAATTPPVKMSTLEQHRQRPASAGTIPPAVPQVVQIAPKRDPHAAKRVRRLSYEGRTLELGLHKKERRVRQLARDKNWLARDDAACRLQRAQRSWSAKHRLQELDDVRRTELEESLALAEEQEKELRAAMAAKEERRKSDAREGSVGLMQRVGRGALARHRLRPAGQYTASSRRFVRDSLAASTVQVFARGWRSSVYVEGQRHDHLLRVTSVCDRKALDIQRVFRGHRGRARAWLRRRRLWQRDAAKRLLLVSLASHTRKRLAVWLLWRDVRTVERVAAAKQARRQAIVDRLLGSNDSIHLRQRFHSWREWIPMPVAVILDAPFRKFDSAGFVEDMTTALKAPADAVRFIRAERGSVIAVFRFHAAHQKLADEVLRVVDVPNHPFTKAFRDGAAVAAGQLDSRHNPVPRKLKVQGRSRCLARSSALPILRRFHAALAKHAKLARRRRTQRVLAEQLLRSTIDGARLVGWRRLRLGVRRARQRREAGRLEAATLLNARTTWWPRLRLAARRSKQRRHAAELLLSNDRVLRSAYFDKGIEFACMWRLARRTTKCGMLCAWSALAHQGLVWSRMRRGCVRLRQKRTVQQLAKVTALGLSRRYWQVVRRFTAHRLKRRRQRKLAEALLSHNEDLVRRKVVPLWRRAARLRRHERVAGVLMASSDVTLRRLRWTTLAKYAELQVAARVALLQRVGRGFAERTDAAKEMARRSVAAAVIQETGRGCISRVRLRAWLDEWARSPARAAAQIQAHWRGSQGRTAAAQRRSSQELCAPRAHVLSQAAADAVTATALAGSVITAVLPPSWMINERCAVRIQAMWRGSRDRRYVRDRRHSMAVCIPQKDVAAFLLVRVARGCGARVEAARMVRQSQLDGSATRIQAGWRGRQGRKKHQGRSREVRLAARVLQAAGRGYFGRIVAAAASGVKAVHSSATRIQAGWRGRQGRRQSQRMAKEVCAARVLQCAGRGMFGRIVVAAASGVRAVHGSATRIQAGWRGRQGRRESKRRALEVGTASRQIQATGRGSMSRQQLGRRYRATSEMQLAAAVALQAVGRGLAVRQTMLEEEGSAATRIQCGWRRRQSTKDVEERRAQKAEAAARQKAAAGIQNNWRRHSARQSVSYMREEDVASRILDMSAAQAQECEAALMLIQPSGRGFLARKRMVPLRVFGKGLKRHAINLIQIVGRGALARYSLQERSPHIVVALDASFSSFSQEAFAAETAARTGLQVSVVSVQRGSTLVVFNLKGPRAKQKAAGVVKDVGCGDLKELCGVEVLGAAVLSEDGCVPDIIGRWTRPQPTAARPSELRVLLQKHSSSELQATGRGMMERAALARRRYVRHLLVGGLTRQMWHLGILLESLGCDVSAKMTIPGEKEARAATTIQRVYRGHAARTSTTAGMYDKQILVMLRHEAGDVVLEDAAAVTVQRCWRGHATRAEVTEMREERERQREKRKGQSATQIQTVFRGHRARQDFLGRVYDDGVGKLVESGREAEEEAAAQSMQRAFRGHTARVRCLRRQYDRVESTFLAEQDESATRIQRVFRGFVVRGPALRCARAVQPLGRGMAARTALADLAWRYVCEHFARSPAHWRDKTSQQRAELLRRAREDAAERQQKLLMSPVGRRRALLHACAVRVQSAGRAASVRIGLARVLAVQGRPGQPESPRRIRRRLRDHCASRLQRVAKGLAARRSVSRLRRQ